MSHASLERMFTGGIHSGGWRMGCRCSRRLGGYRECRREWGWPGGVDCERDRGFVASDGRGTVRRGLRCRWALAFMRGLSDCPWSGLKNSLAAECARIWHAGCVSMLGGAFCGGAEAECNIRPGNRHEQRDETVARHVGFESGKPYAQIRQHLQGGRKGRKLRWDVLDLH